MAASRAGFRPVSTPPLAAGSGSTLRARSFCEALDSAPFAPLTSIPSSLLVSSERSRQMEMEGERCSSPSIASKRVLASPRPMGHVWVYSRASSARRPAIPSGWQSRTRSASLTSAKLGRQATSTPEKPTPTLEEGLDTLCVGCALKAMSEEERHASRIDTPPRRRSAASWSTPPESVDLAASSAGTCGSTPALSARSCPSRRRPPHRRVVHHLRSRRHRVQRVHLPGFRPADSPRSSRPSAGCTSRSGVSRLRAKPSVDPAHRWP